MSFGVLWLLPLPRRAFGSADWLDWPLAGRVWRVRQARNHPDALSGLRGESPNPSSHIPVCDVLRGEQRRPVRDCAAGRRLLLGGAGLARFRHACFGLLMASAWLARMDGKIFRDMWE